MRILVSGASGLVGSALVPYLELQGHTVVRLVRDRSKQGIFWDPPNGVIELPADMHIDAVINLSGENIAAGRWTKQRKEKILSSRINTNSLLARTITEMNPKPKAFLSASGVGYYGDCRDVIVNEDRPAGKGFLVDVSWEWEAAAKPVQGTGIRVVYLRISPVLSSEGGMLRRLLPLFKFGMGAALGSGRQYMSWIAIDDLIRAIEFIACSESLSGPVNMCSPNPVTNREFTKALNRVLKRPTLFRIPVFILKAIFGEMADEELLYSTRAVPQRLTDSGFEFKYPTIEEALRHVLGRE
jgi:uncharacterized protein (TIGR01777 family)